MAFKTVQSYNEERYGGFFQLRNDGDYADVIFLYQNNTEVLVADTHYIKSADYTGYAHCCGKGCPACAKGIRTQTKLFVPLYNIAQDKIEFFDRTMKFEPQLQLDVFAKFPNPSEFVFRIIRHGAAGDVNTTYEITALSQNTVKSYAQILVDNNAAMPDYYNTICRELSIAEMQNMLNDVTTPAAEYSASGAASNYGAVPRGTTPAPASIPEPPAIQMPTYAEPPVYEAPAGNPGEEDTAGAGTEDELTEPDF